ncbi:MAG: hypothetical protein ACOC1X_02170 [Promethearchaeota archaeon]
MEAILDKYSHDDLICARCGSDEIYMTLSGKYWYCGECNSRKVKPKERVKND